MPDEGDPPPGHVNVLNFRLTLAIGGTLNWPELFRTGVMADTASREAINSGPLLVELVAGSHRTELLFLAFGDESFW